MSSLAISGSSQLVMIPDSKIHGPYMGPIWGRQDPGGSHVGPMDFAIWDANFVVTVGNGCCHKDKVRALIVGKISIVVITTSAADNDDKVGIPTSLGFQCAMSKYTRVTYFTKEIKPS